MSTFRPVGGKTIARRIKEGKRSGPGMTFFFEGGEMEEGERVSGMGSRGRKGDAEYWVKVEGEMTRKVGRGGERGDEEN